MSGVRPLVSVVVPLYNGEAFIGRALDSVLAQDWRPLEVIVVDDGSTDGGAALVDRRAADAPEGVSLRCLRQENAGQAAATNRGIGEARGAFLALQDADDEWLPGRLEKTVAPMLKDPEIGLSYCWARARFEDGSERPLNAGREALQMPGGLYPPPRVCVPATSFRSEVFERLGGFDPAILPGNDVDMFLRTAERFRVHRVEEELVIVHVRRDSQQRGHDLDRKILSRLRWVEKAVERRGLGPDAARRARAAAAFDCALVCRRFGRMGGAWKWFLKSCLLRPSRMHLRMLPRFVAPRRLLRPGVRPAPEERDS